MAVDVHNRAANFRAKGLAYLILGEIKNSTVVSSDTSYEKRIQEAYIEKALQYIVKNYSRTIRIELCEYIGLNRSYFSAIFKRLVGYSPQEYLVLYRLNKAARLLINSQLAM